MEVTTATVALLRVPDVVKPGVRAIVGVTAPRRSLRVRRALRTRYAPPCSRVGALIDLYG